MNLGDGLMFELENGKPRLTLSKHGVETKNPNKILSRNRPHNVLNPKQLPQEPLVPEELPRVQARRKDPRRKAAPVPGAVAVKKDMPVAAYNPTKAKDNTDNNTKPGPRGRSAKALARQRQTIPDRDSKATKEAGKESLVCLTNDQLQQILSTINKASTTTLQEQELHSQAQTGNAEGSNEGLLANGTGGGGSGEGLLLTSNPSGRNGHSQDNGLEEKRWMSGLPPGLFSALGERERDKEVLEAKKAQWRRELDEQMDLKKQQKLIPEAMQERGLMGRPFAGTLSKPLAGEESRRRTASALTDTETQRCSSQRDLPAAIRSAFIPGEATPVEHAFSAQKREQQRLWLQELDQQREDDKLRRRHEKQQNSQGEDHEHWAQHFDSIQKRLPPQVPLAVQRGGSEPLSSLGHQRTPSGALAMERGASEALSSLGHQRTPSGALSVAWDCLSTYGGDSLGRASVDTTTVFTQKSSHLRTMTALLDPTQIEERERKRLKQQEHQRAIEAQVEERRRQREVEAAARRALEVREERRVELERQLMEQQHQLDTQRQRHKEELQSRKTEVLYQSVQRAQEEALKDKHQQRIRELARKGHDVSKLLHALQGDPGSSQVFSVRDSLSSRPCQTGAEGEEAFSAMSPRKDTAMQTEVVLAIPAFPGEALGGQGRGVQTPDVPVEYGPPPHARRARRGARQDQERCPGTGKENVCLNDGGGGGAAGEGGDPYEAYARTYRGGQRQRGGRRPDWNTKRPSKPFVPASERYPLGLQHSRQESRLRRQMELMTLVERNTLSKTPQPDPPLSSSPPPPHPTQPHAQARNRHSPVRKGENPFKGMTNSTAVPAERVRSPPVPAVKHRLQTQSLQPPRDLAPNTQGQGPHQEADSPPPMSDFVPYLRTDEVYHLDPLAPISRPPTQPHQHTHTEVTQSRAGSPPHQRDPLLHPELLKNRERQQAILKGLSELRQGLLQKQRELESGLNPLLKVYEGTHSPPLQHM